MTNSIKIIKRRVDEKANEYPKKLSGGEQRVVTMPEPSP
jgi:ABC-type polar amino acid transport system ATPase subunit